MSRTLAALSWLWFAGALLAGATIPFTDLSNGWIWDVVALAAGVTAGLVSWRFNRLPLMFSVVLLGAALHLTTSGLSAPSVGPVGPNWPQALSDLTINAALMAVLVTALRARRGAFDGRDIADGITIAIGALLVGWIALANPMANNTEAEPVLALLSAAYLPIGVMLISLTIALLMSGLSRNHSMWFLLIAVCANLTGDAIRGLVEAQVVSSDLRAASLGAYLAAYLTGCAAISHPDAPGVLAPEDRLSTHPRRSALRLLVLAASMLGPLALIAAVAPTGVVDIAVRTVVTLALAVSVVARLFRALAENAAAQESLIRRLNRDELTGLPNRNFMAQCVADELERTWRSDQLPAIIQLNLDRFKNINDSLGHTDANRVLVAISERLTRAAAEFGGVVARTGGDDFMILDATTTSRDEAIERADEVRRVLASGITVGSGTVFVTSSVGVAEAPRNRTISAEELMRRADIATHRAKTDGRDRVAAFDDSMQANLAHRMDVENALYGAIARQEMRLYYQPIVNVTTGSVGGFEALMRWQRGVDTLVPPMEFIPIAEETGVITELGQWALVEALTQLRKWVEDGLVEPSTTMSVNVSPRQIADPDFLAVVGDAIASVGVAPELLWIEVTESMMLTEPDLARTTLEEIRAMGVGLALDDFGTGYSSLSMLQQFPIQRIKIDRAFINGIADTGNDRSLVRTVIAMGESMHLDVVAEGVETIHQLQSLRDLNCAHAQGYLISHPVPADAMRSTMGALQELADLSMFDAAKVEPGEPAATNGTHIDSHVARERASVGSFEHGNRTSS